MQEVKSGRKLTTFNAGAFVKKHIKNVPLYLAVISAIRSGVNASAWAEYNQRYEANSAYHSTVLQKNQDAFENYDKLYAERSILLNKNRHAVETVSLTEALATTTKEDYAKIQHEKPVFTEPEVVPLWQDYKVDGAKNSNNEVESNSVLNKALDSFFYNSATNSGHKTLSHSSWWDVPQLTNAQQQMSDNFQKLIEDSLSEDAFTKNFGFDIVAFSKLSMDEVVSRFAPLSGANGWAEPPIEEWYENAPEWRQRGLVLGTNRGNTTAESANKFKKSAIHEWLHIVFEWDEPLTELITKKYMGERSYVTANTDWWYRCSFEENFLTLPEVDSTAFLQAAATSDVTLAKYWNENVPNVIYEGKEVPVITHEELYTARTINQQLNAVCPSNMKDPKMLSGFAKKLGVQQGNLGNKFAVVGAALDRLLSGGNNPKDIIEVRSFIDTANKFASDYGIVRMQAMNDDRLYGQGAIENLKAEALDVFENTVLSDYKAELSKKQAAYVAASAAYDKAVNDEKDIKAKIDAMDVDWKHAQQKKEEVAKEVLSAKRLLDVARADLNKNKMSIAGSFGTLLMSMGLTVALNKRELSYKRKKRTEEKEDEDSDYFDFGYDEEDIAFDLSQDLKKSNVPQHIVKDTAPKSEKAKPVKKEERLEEPLINVQEPPKQQSAPPQQTQSYPTQPQSSQATPLQSAQPQARRPVNIPVSGEVQKQIAANQAKQAFLSNLLTSFDAQFPFATIAGKKTEMIAGVTANQKENQVKAIANGGIRTDLAKALTGVKRKGSDGVERNYYGMMQIIEIGELLKAASRLNSDPNNQIDYFEKVVNNPLIEAILRDISRDASGIVANMIQTRDEKRKGATTNNDNLK